MWCIPEITPEYERNMMDVLGVYERPYDPLKPTVCFDEKSVPLRGTTRDPLPMRPGRVIRHDSEYTREGTANVFITVEPKGNHRTAIVTARRKKGDFAREMKRLADEVYPAATTIVMVLDNLNTHFEKSLYDTFSSPEATRLIKRFEFHYTPIHASWLNMAEIEIGVYARQCLRHGIDSREKLSAETNAWVRMRNQQRAGINWQFTREKAMKKFHLNERKSICKN